ncbi:MAG: heme exporter protein CcmB [Lentisphaeria bacterium]|nr:heme exporter protein CcmB [Candidatus Neomarinimicrobiota bacterium]MCF7841545.1 heme exporter protein CcmB [Lentisphaeria bacterium]
MNVIWAIIRKDFQMEFRTKESITAMWIFSLLIFVIFNFTFEISRLLLLQISGGLLWVAFIFSGMLGLNRSFQVERENGNLRGLSLTPADPGLIYFGKFLSTTFFMLIFEALIFPLFIIFYDIQLSLVTLWIIPISILGTLGFTSLGTILSAVAIHTKQQQILLSLLLWPLITPIIIWAVKTTGDVLAGELSAAFQPVMVRMLVFDVIFTTISYLLFEYVVQE